MTAQEEHVPLTENLLAAAGYVGAGQARQLIDLSNLIMGLHGPQEGDIERPMVCTTCRDSDGRKVAFPCPEFVRFAEITDLRIDPAGWAEAGVSLPASMCRPQAVQESPPQAIEPERPTTS